jgi:hypothetical protein
MTQLDEVRAGGSYNSTNDMRLHFGLGDQLVMTKVDVHWPSGLRQEFRDVQADAFYEIRERQDIRRVALLPPPSAPR